MDFNLGDLAEIVAATVPDRIAILHGDHTSTYAQLNERTRRLANYLLAQGLGVEREREALEPWESGQHLLACYLHNSAEYLETMIGAYKARVAPFNVNYRYVTEELVYLLTDAGATAIVYHSAFAPLLDAVRTQVPSLRVLLQVTDGSGNGLLPGAVWYEDALAGSDAGEPDVKRSPDDLYVLYTGGTTGMPKGVLWRQADIFPAALGGRSILAGEVITSVEVLVDHVRNNGARVLPAAPFMHGAAHWAAPCISGGRVNSLVAGFSATRLAISS